MSQRIIYYYAVASGFAYLGEPRLRRIAAKAGAQIDYRPVDIRKVFAAGGSTPPPEQSPQRLNYRFADLARWGRRLGMAINPKPAFWPVHVRSASLAVLAASELDYDPGPLSFAFLHAVYAEDRNIADPETVRAIVEATLLEAEASAVLLAAETPETAALYDHFTGEAVAAGAFGSPTYIVDGELFFGQDRLDFVAEKLGVAL